MALELMISAQTKWRILDGANLIAVILQEIAFKGGIKHLNVSVAAALEHPR
jgi:hypothetical protein